MLKFMQLLNTKSHLNVCILNSSYSSGKSVTKDAQLIELGKKEAKFDPKQLFNSFMQNSTVSQFE